MGKKTSKAINSDVQWKRTRRNYEFIEGAQMSKQLYIIDGKACLLVNL